MSSVQVSPNQIDFNEVLSSFVGLIIVFMVMSFTMKMMDTTLEPAKERYSLPAIEPPPGYVPVWAPQRAPTIEVEREQLEAKKLAHEDIGRQIAGQAGVRFLRLDTGWQATYTVVRYWFEDDRGNEIVATDVDELRWKLGFIG